MVKAHRIQVDRSDCSEVSVWIWGVTSFGGLALLLLLSLLFAFLLLLFLLPFLLFAAMVVWRRGRGGRRRAVWVGGGSILKQLLQLLDPRNRNSREERRGHAIRRLDRNTAGMWLRCPVLQATLVPIANLRTEDGHVAVDGVWLWDSTISYNTGRKTVNTADVTRTVITH